MNQPHSTTINHTFVLLFFCDKSVHLVFRAGCQEKQVPRLIVVGKTRSGYDPTAILPRSHNLSVFWSDPGAIQVDFAKTESAARMPEWTDALPCRVAIRALFKHMIDRHPMQVSGRGARKKTTPEPASIHHPFVAYFRRVIFRFLFRAIFSRRTRLTHTHTPF